MVDDGDDTDEDEEPMLWSSISIDVEGTVEVTDGDDGSIHADDSWSVIS